ncbi:MAG: hypothetical protein HC871_07365 [Rhizobiales bacterium]|nr:hypothetical protein [Hyphomicrobiales bacterium]
MKAGETDLAEIVIAQGHLHRRVPRHARAQLASARQQGAAFETALETLRRQTGLAEG